GGPRGAPRPRPRRAAAARGGPGSRGAACRCGRRPGGCPRPRRGAARRRTRRRSAAGGRALRRVANGWVLPVSVLLAIVLGLVPLPEMLQPLRPYWLALVV